MFLDNGKLSRTVFDGIEDTKIFNEEIGILCTKHTIESRITCHIRCNILINGTGLTFVSLLADLINYSTSLSYVKLQGYKIYVNLSIGKFIDQGALIEEEMLSGHL